MSLVAGTRLGPYELQSLIGQGGMGEVYKARDTRLERSVAIKVLPPEFGADPDRRARFEREAKTIAGLNNPHICTLYDVGEHAPSTGTGQAALYLVMEHLAGETLAQRLERGPLPLDQALEIATQVADALSAAHRQGVVHRDLKPGNVMLTKAGAKLLDFGLAKLTGHGEQAAAASIASAPTQTRPLTSEGAIVGTLEYMAPEQVEGKPADARTDLWALGAILYEMLTGRRAFGGDSAASLIGNIMNAEPAALWTLQPLTPPAVDRLVRRCLAKVPDARWQDASDVADELQWIRGGGSAVTGPEKATPRGRYRQVVTGALLLAVVAGIGTGVTWLWVGGRRVAEVRHGLEEIRPAEALLGGLALTNIPSISRNRPHLTALRLTRDGRRLVFAGNEPSAGNQNRQAQLYIRDVWGREGAKAIPHTAGADAPLISPDGEWVAFWSRSSAPAGWVWVLSKVRLEDAGTPVPICTVGRPPMGADWGDDGFIVFADGESGGLLRVSEDGGTPTVLTKLATGEYSHRLPHVLPKSKALLYTVVQQRWDWESARVMVRRIGVQETPREVLRGAADARYLPTGHLIYFRRGQMMAAAFDLDRMQLRAGSQRGLDVDVMQATNEAVSNLDSGAAQVAVSASGTLAYVAGGQGSDNNKTLVWVDRHGRMEDLRLAPRPYYAPQVSPDGRRVAMHTFQSERRVLVCDIERPDAPTPVTPAGYYPEVALWSPDGQYLVFGAAPEGIPGLFRTKADGTQPPERLLELDSREFESGVPSSWASDEQLVFVTSSRTTQTGIRLLTLADGKRESSVLFDKPGVVENHASMRPPDGRWLAFATQESGRPEVCIVRFPTLTDRKVVASNAYVPVWSRSGEELFYIKRQNGLGTRELVAHRIGKGGEVAPSGERLFPLSKINAPVYTSVHGFDVSEDGRFLFTRYADTPPPPATHIHVIENWLEELKQKVPAQR